MFYHLLQKERMHALVCYYQSMFINICRTNTDVVFVGVKRKDVVNVQDVLLLNVAPVDFAWI